MLEPHAKQGNCIDQADGTLPASSGADLCINIVCSDCTAVYCVNAVSHFGSATALSHAGQ